MDPYPPFSALKTRVSGVSVIGGNRGCFWLLVCGSATIPRPEIRVERVAYCPVRIPTHFEGPTGSWPDPLLGGHPAVEVLWQPQ